MTNMNWGTVCIVIFVLIIFLIAFFSLGQQPEGPETDDTPTAVDSDLAAEWYVDERIPRMPINTSTIKGNVIIGGPGEMSFVNDEQEIDMFPDVPANRIVLYKPHNPDKQMQDSIEYGSSLNSFRVLNFLFGGKK